MRDLRPTARTRIAAWLLTGPLGHLYGTLADIATLLAREGVRRLRRRWPWGKLG